MASIPFTKMQAFANDFIVINALEHEYRWTTEVIQSLSHRKLGIGFDQLLILLPSHTAQADFFMKIFNADGSEAYQCGNGLRCMARYIAEKGLSSKNPLHIATEANIYEVYVEALDCILANMREPVLDLEKIPFIKRSSETKPYSYPISISGYQFDLTPISMGNPHGVIFLEDIDAFPVEEVGKRLSEHEQFPRQANIEFVEIISKSHIRIRIYERGAGETQACGSGACAAMAAAYLHHLVNEKVTVSMRGGQLQVSWSGISHPLWMRGEAHTVFEGCFNL